MRIRPKPMALAATAALLLAATTMSAVPVEARDRVVVVGAGQTLSGIAAAHDTSVRRLMRLNRLSDPNRIYPGQILRLAPVHRQRSKIRIVHHRVTYGQTLTAIAARYGTGIDAIVQRNRLADASRIYAGQVLRIAVRRDRASGHRPSPHEQQPRFQTHLVRYGETVSGLAMRYRVSVESIVVANRLDDPGFIRAGQQLRIPVGRGSVASHPTPGLGDHLAVQLPPEMAAVVASRDGMRRLIVSEARRAGVPPALALAVAWQESGWQPGVVSSAGAIGVMQLLPATADWVGASMLGERVNLWQARSNVRAGVTLLAHYLGHYHGNRSLVLAAYYQGEAGTDQHGIYPVSRPYIASILLLQSMFSRR